MCQSDSKCKLLCRTCNRLQLAVDVVYTQEAATAAYSTATYTITIIDQRSHKQTAGNQALQLKALKSSTHGVIIAFVSKSFATKEGAITSVLQKGFNRWLIESTNEGHVMNELQLLLNADVTTALHLKATDTLFAAVDECKDIVEITDTNFHVLYVNKTCVEVLGWQADELYDRHLLRVHQLLTSRPEQADKITSQLTRSLQYDGHFLCQRRSGSNLLLPCRAFPIAVNSKSVDHYVFVKECPAFVLDRNPPINRFTTRASIRSLRKPSFDHRPNNHSNIVRRTSLARTPSVIETPITKVIGLVMDAQEASPMVVAHELEKVLEILRSAELYSPPLISNPGSSSKDFVGIKSQDPVANDLLGGLLSQGPSFSPFSGGMARRLSDGLPRVVQQNRPPLSSLQHNSTAIQTLLDRDLDWSFDIFCLEQLTSKRPLVWLGMHIFMRFDVASTLGIDTNTLENWLNLVEASYHQQNSYHNSTHAADVLQCTAYFLERQCLKKLLSPVEEAVCLIAAAVHDIDHPGKNSQFMCNSGSELALLYNDVSVLESHHAAFAFKVTLSDQRVNIFKNLDDALYKKVRQGIVDMVLATEMTKHFEHLSKFLNAFSGPAVTNEMEAAATNSDDTDLEKLCSPENMTLIKRMLIKCADVSNPLRAREYCVEWANRIAEEYFSQTDAEKELKIPVVMPIFDRTTCSIPKSQIGFIEFFINDLFEAWDSLIDIPELIENLESNYQYWSGLEQNEQQTTSRLAGAHLASTAEESASLVDMERCGSTSTRDSGSLGSADHSDT